MASLMAICGNGHVVDGLISLGPGAQIILEDVKARCRVCGDWATIPDGSYQFEGGRITRRDIAAMASELGALTQDELRALRRLLAGSDQLPEELRERAPITAKGLDLFGPRSAVIGTWVSVLLALIALYLGGRTPNETVVNTTINQTFDQIEGGTTRVPKVGRNEACPCASGKKFRYCHGR